MTTFAEILAKPVRVRNGDPSPLERLQRKSTINTDGCWTWNGCLNSRGYGCTSLNGTVVLVHRLSYYLHYGEIADGMTVDHGCHNADRNCKGSTSCLHRRCWNPKHLFEMTIGENSARARGGWHQEVGCRPRPDMWDDGLGRELTYDDFPSWEAYWAVRLPRMRATQIAETRRAVADEAA
jgi:hypothetical protein